MSAAPFLRALVLLCFALLVGAPLQASAEGALLVVIDPGHGGDKDGAVGPDGTREKDLVLEIALRMESALLAAGHRVVLTRRDDTGLGLAERVELANERGADLFLSVHANSMPTLATRRRVHGVETFFLSADATDAAAAAVAKLENADDVGRKDEKATGALGAILADLARSETHANSSQLAYVLHDHLVRGTGARDRGVRQAPFVVLEGAAMPAVLLEVGYISHPAEVKRLADPAEQEKIAAAVAAGVDRFAREVLQRQARSTLGNKQGAAALQ